MPMVALSMMVLLRENASENGPAPPIMHLIVSEKEIGKENENEIAGISFFLAPLFWYKERACLQ